MMRPGTRLRRIAARWCSVKTMERLVDPALADLQLEYESAVISGRKWKRRWVWSAGHLAFLKMIAAHGTAQALGLLHDLTSEDRQTLTRTFGYCAGIMMLGTLLLVVPFLDMVPLSHPHSATLLLYLLPQTLPLSVPVGLTFGILWGFGRAAASRRSRTVVLFVAVTFSAVSFTMLAWVVPATNQAFRVSLMGRPVMKGVNELTLGELSQLIETRRRDPLALPASRDIRSLALNYHGRWALAGAPFVLSLFSVSVTHRRRRGRLILGLAGCAAISGYYIIMYTAKQFGLDRTVPVLAVAWTPNVAFLLLSLVTRYRPLAHRPSPG